MKKSKLVLGTVQLGMPYGVANATGVPSKEESFAILDAAYNSGINTFDTAPVYGSAEEVLGGWIASRSLKDKVYVVSKIMSATSEAIAADIEASLRRLQVDTLDGCLLHAAEDMYNEQLLTALQEARKRGLCDHIGVSVYDTKDVQAVLASGFDYAQVPYNVFDTRFEQANFFDNAKKSGMTTFARSPFLQGLLLMEPKTVPTHLFAALPHLERFRALATAHGVSPLQAALAYVLQHDGIDHVVFGVESLNQLKELVAIKEINEKLFEELNHGFKNIEESILNPSLWQK